MATLQELRRTLDTRTGAETPITAPTPVTPGPVPEVARRPKHALPHPSIFDGTNLMDYASFKGFLRTKYRTDAAAIGGETGSHSARLGQRITALCSHPSQENQ